MRILSLIAVVLFVSSLDSPAQAGMAEDCEQFGDWNLNISGCTAMIHSGQYSGRNLAAAYEGRGFGYRMLGEYRRAIKDYDQALRLDPDDGDAYLGRAIAYWHFEEWRRVIEDYGQVLRLDPGNASAYHDRGRAYANLSEHAQAIENYDQVLRIDPSHWVAYNHRATALYLLGRNTEALGDANRSLALSPGEPNPLETRAHILAALGRRSEALAEFERAMQAGGAGWVRWYKELLTKHGYYRGVINGVYGPESRAALMACLEARCRLVE